MQIPSLLLDSLEYAKGFDKEAFEKVHASGDQVVSIRLNPLKPLSQFPNFPMPLSPVPWTEFGYYLESRPSFTFDPLFHAGCYYVQEASSMFLEQALKQTVDLSRPIKVLDLCGAPGGKSTHIQSLISPASLLVSNETIRSRANILKDNIIKWGAGNVVVTHNDPADFSRLENYFDVIVVDAPCSGSGLFRRDPEAIEQWSGNNVLHCSLRQQRILADAWPALKEEGILIYSTCSYSKQEDEEIVEWVKSHFAADIHTLTIPGNWNIVESSGGYRFWPDKVRGEGFFLACFRKKQPGKETQFRIKNKAGVISKNDSSLLEKWVKKEDLVFIKHGETVYGWPANLATDFGFLLEQLRVIYSGVLAGELMREKLVPAHALALSKIVSNAVLRTELDKEESVRYLQRKELSTLPANKGWQLVTYQQHPLGWMNVLPNRVNNYYPKELRILKDI